MTSKSKQLDCTCNYLGSVGPQNHLTGSEDLSFKLLVGRLKRS